MTNEPTLSERYNSIVAYAGEAMEPEGVCPPDCPECGGNGFIGGDTGSVWICTLQSGRIFRNMYRKNYSRGASS